jgi:hypothetical protein
METWGGFLININIPVRSPTHVKKTVKYIYNLKKRGT